MRGRAEAAAEAAAAAAAAAGPVLGGSGGGFCMLQIYLAAPVSDPVRRLQKVVTAASRPSIVQEDVVKLWLEIIARRRSE